MGPELAALQKHRFDWVHSLESVWHDSDLHVEALHAVERARILAAFDEAQKGQRQPPASGSPPGLFLVGGKGLGKTHLLGSVRRKVWEREGYFFLVELLDGRSFWQCVVNAYLEGLTRPLGDGRRQVDVWAERIAGRFGLAKGKGDYRFLVGPHFDTKLVGLLLGRFRSPKHAGLRLPSGYRQLDVEDTLRALLLLKSTHEQAVLGQMMLLGLPLDEEDKRALGFHRNAIGAQACVFALSWLLGQTGATLVAFDQLDVLLDTLAVMKQPDQLAQIAHGLMDMKEHTTATLTVVSCFPETMTYIEQKAVGAAKDRFRLAPVTLSRQIDGAMAEDIVARRFAAGNARAGFEPPYPTWPIARSAFARKELPDFTPRELITEVAQHVSRCIDRGAVSELTSFRQPAQPPTGHNPAPPNDHAPLDRMFEDFRTAPASVPTPADEDTVVPALLRAGLEAWINERADEGKYAFETDFGKGTPALHARLRKSLDEASEAEEIWSFRAIGAPHHATVRSRLRQARTATGAGLLKELRHLIILRSTPWPNGASTAAAVAELAQDGGRIHTLALEEVRILGALKRMIEAQPQGLTGWLRARRPTRQVALFAHCLPNGSNGGAPSPDGGLPPAGKTENGEAENGEAENGKAENGEAEGGKLVGDTADGTRPPPSATNLDDPHTMPVGFPGAPEDGAAAVLLPLSRLRQHVAVFAGSGSGKTVLLRRLVEQAALRGVSSIVLDSNNDLARLGEAWPTPPQGWAPGDDGRAGRLFQATEVVIWTPGRADGRALNLRPLPDFAAISGDAFELQQAIDMATATLSPLAGCDGTTQTAQRARAILKSAIEVFARMGGGDLHSFIALLAELPDTISDIRNAPNIAAGLADNLIAQRQLNVLLRDQGEPLDPGLLFAPKPGKSARISVISLVGLPDQSVKESFVNQLQMALFAWLKKNPAKTDLGGLFVMDEAQNFAPSAHATACRQSTISLVSQARKYGLGMIFATQAPKGIHNGISGNCTTQFFGRLNHPTQIDAARELASARGGRVDDISTLSAGVFYVSSEGLGVTRLRMPNCLSHHPSSPPSDDEVLARARIRET
ncbi:helicase HerA domain-containing protein [Xanthobacter autotrophicus]|uniref:helicase HerA domain-containing protein n=1 Tax=Xanthobacter autotrophicus TaxID=280 RepID=UPI00372AF269